MGAEEFLEALQKVDFKKVPCRMQENELRTLKMVLEWACGQTQADLLDEREQLIQGIKNCPIGRSCVKCHYERVMVQALNLALGEEAGCGLP